MKSWILELFLLVVHLAFLASQRGPCVSNRSFRLERLQQVGVQAFYENGSDCPPPTGPPAPPISGSTAVRSSSGSGTSGSSSSNVGSGSQGSTLRGSSSGTSGSSSNRRPGVNTDLRTNTRVNSNSNTRTNTNVKTNSDLTDPGKIGKSVDNIADPLNFRSKLGITGAGETVGGAIGKRRKRRGISIRFILLKTA